ncbi:WYL domain-containing protein [Rhodomicrobium vannielii ATCC 17100]|uniref:WYL domain-containing protein n=1 Tax=Rhodomicrobium vannielii TaxID=1069 RepID=UPI001918F7A6|nr:WYL domain-containing protein [Rhodomicrobium vannielii]MBJ7533747.1 WYL domain-containing protein [Rhodomicrobium vannielii ATCC 17100]
MDATDERLRWGTEQRLEFIEFRAFWEGGIRRGDITGQFGVSVPQASNDLALYQRLAPLNLRYDASEKRYVPTADFAPRFMKPDADRYLDQLWCVADGLIGFDETWIVRAPEAGVVPVPRRRIESSVLKRLVGVIRDRRSIEILYQSMTSRRADQPIWRRITPHAFAHDGMRWHVRAFCHLDEKFKDFLLSRCREVRGDGAAGADAADDSLWHTMFTAVLVPNPELAASQQETIALDYGMTNGQAEIPIRRALLYYFNKRMRLDLPAGIDKPAERPVVVANIEALRQALDEASG